MGLFDGAFGGGGQGILPDWLFNPQYLQSQMPTIPGGGGVPMQAEPSGAPGIGMTADMPFANRWSGVSALPPMQSVENSPLSISEMLAGGRMAYAPQARPVLNPINAGDEGKLPPNASPTVGQAPAPQQHAGLLAFPQGNPLPEIGNRIASAGAGFFNAGSPMQAIGNLIGGLVTGQRQDSAGIAQANQRAAQLAGIQYIANDPTIDPNMKAAMLQNPALAASYLASRAKPPEYKFENAGPYFGGFNPQTGRLNIQGAKPEFQKVSPGETGSYVTPGVPGSGPSATQVLSGGPEKPPSGFEYADPKNPAAGLKPIPGGPATQMTGDLAGRLALLQASKTGLQEAKSYFLSDSFKSGPLDAAGKAIGQATNTFEISRHRRAVNLAAEAALRVATGATAPPDEVARYADFYTPSVYDSKETRKQKLEALERFTTYAERNMGQGRMPPPEFFMSGGSMTGKPGETITSYGEWKTLPGGVKAREIKR